MNARILLPVALLAALSPLSGVALGQKAATPAVSYEVINLGTPLGGTFANAQTLSMQGFVAGYSNVTGDLAEHAVLWHPDGANDLGTFGGKNSAVLGNLSGFAETATPDPLAQDFCGIGTHLTCLAFILENQSEVALPTLGGTSAIAFGNNTSGQAVGSSLTTTQDPGCLVDGKPQPPLYEIQQALPAVWKNGKVSTLPLLSGDSDGEANANNDAGQITGSSGDCLTNPAAHALLWKNGKVTNLGSLGGAKNQQPVAINNQGQITGGSDLTGDTVQHAFLWDKGKMQDLGTLPGDTFSFGNSINNLSQVVGNSCDANFNCRAFIWQNGTMTDLNTLIPSNSTLVLNYAATIDDVGVIAGYAVDPNTNAAPAFVLIPNSGQFTVVPHRADAVPRAVMSDSLRALVQQRMKARGARRIAPTFSDSQK